MCIKVIVVLPQSPISILLLLYRMTLVMLTMQKRNSPNHLISHDVMERFSKTQCRYFPLLYQLLYLRWYHILNSYLSMSSSQSRCTSAVTNESRTWSRCGLVEKSFKINKLRLVAFESHVNWSDWIEFVQELFHFVSCSPSSNKIFRLNCESVANSFKALSASF